MAKGHVLSKCCKNRGDPICKTCSIQTFPSYANSNINRSFKPSASVNPHAASAKAGASAANPHPSPETERATGNCATQTPWGLRHSNAVGACAAKAVGCSGSLYGFLAASISVRHAIIKHWQATSRGEPGNIKGITPETLKKFIIDPTEKMMRKLQVKKRGA